MFCLQFLGSGTKPERFAFASTYYSTSYFVQWALGDLHGIFLYIILISQPFSMFTEISHAMLQALQTIDLGLSRKALVFAGTEVRIQIFASLLPNI